MIPGTVSHATLRTPDLLMRFCSYIAHDGDEDSQKALYKILLDYMGEVADQEDVSWEDWCDAKPDDASYLLHEEIFPLMDRLAEPGFYFGNTEGDGSDFGFWPTFINGHTCDWQDISEALEQEQGKLTDDDDLVRVWKEKTKALDEPCYDCGWSYSQVAYFYETGRNPHLEKEKEHNLSFINMFFCFTAGNVIEGLRVAEANVLSINKATERLYATMHYSPVVPRLLTRLIKALLTAYTKLLMRQGEKHHKIYFQHHMTKHAFNSFVKGIRRAFAHFMEG